MLGAIAMKILAEIFPSAQRIALIGMINNKQAVPIQPKRRLTFARLSSEFLVLCMTSQFNQFQFLAGRPTACVTRKWAGLDSAEEQKKLEAKRKPVKRGDSHLSGARCVGRCNSFLYHSLFNSSYQNRKISFSMHVGR
jgi:hypothetical protein